MNSVRWCMLIAAAALFFSSPLDAKKKRKAPAKKPPAAAAAAAAAPAKAAGARDDRVPEVVREEARAKVDTQAAPTLTYDEFGRRKIEIQVADKRAELLRYLDQILAQEPAKDERAELLFQKAELYLEESQFHFFEGMGLDNAIFAATEAKDVKQVTSLKKTKEGELEQSRSWARNAVLLYQEIEEQHPKFPRMPEVLYSLARAFWDVGSFKKALPVYRKLIKEHPKSQYVADAWLAFGEYYFEFADKNERDLDAAIKAYEEAAKFERSTVLGYAVYKLGWCQYNKGRFEESAERFKEVIFYSEINADLLGDRRLQLAREARKDFVLAYSHFANPSTVFEDLKAIAPDDDERYGMITRLADIFYGDGKDRDAIILYRGLMTWRPDSPTNPLLQGKIVKIASRIGEKRQVVSHTKKLVEEYQRVRQRFESLTPEDPQYAVFQTALEEADDVSDNTLRYLATTWHNEAKKTRNDETFGFAYALYADYLTLFSDRKEAYEIRFFYAELLYKLEKFEEAGDQYSLVLKTDGKGKWAQISAEEAVRSYEIVVDELDKKEPPKPKTGKPEPVPIPPLKTKYIDACARYIEFVPNGETLPEVRYKTAKVLYDYNRFDDALPRFMEVVEKHPRHPRAEQAANLVLDTHNLLERWEALSEAARTFSKNKQLMKNESFRQVIATILEQSSFKLIGRYEERGELEEALKRFVAFADEFPKSDLADDSLANAAVLLTRLGRIERAVETRIRLVQLYSDSSLVLDQVVAIAATYERIADFGRAAKWLEELVTRAPKDERAKAALLNASLYREAVGEVDLAVENRRRWLQQYGKGKDADEVAWSIPLTLRRAGRAADAAKELLVLADARQKDEPARALDARYQAVLLLAKDKRAQERALESLVAAARAYRGPRNDDTADAFGFLAFREAEAAYAKFVEKKIAAPDNPAAFKKSLDDKLSTQAAVEKALNAVIETKSSEFVLAATYRLGALSQHVYDTVANVPAPRGLNEEQAMLFRDRLIDQVRSLEEKAASTMEVCLTAAQKAGVFNEWSRQCRAFLEDARPTQYPKTSDEQAPPPRIAVPVDATPAGLIIESPKPGNPPRASSTGAPARLRFVPGESSAPRGPVGEDS